MTPWSIVSNIVSKDQHNSKLSQGMTLSGLTFERISTDESVSIVKYFVQMWGMVQNWLQKDVDSGWS